jgi:hypothetical protein
MFDMNGLIDTDPESCRSNVGRAGVCLPDNRAEFSRREEPNDLKLVEILIDKIIKRLEENSFEPKVQDALKAIQLKQKLSEAKSTGLVKTSEAEKTFWQAIDDISTSEQQRLKNLESKTENLQAQILKNHNAAQI